VGTGFVIARSSAVLILLGAWRQLVSSSGLNVAEATVFIGVGHWLHDTPPIFYDRIMRIINFGSCCFAGVA
jgi:hypothetical protein